MTIIGLVILCPSVAYILMFAAERLIERDSAEWIKRARDALRGR